MITPTMYTSTKLKDWINETDSKVPVYYGSGSSVYDPHITVYQNRYEIVATYFPNGNYYQCPKSVKIFQK